MALRSGKCTNYGLCVKADTREAQSIADGADFVCQECRRPLVSVSTSGASAASSGALIKIVAVLLLLLAIGGGAYLLLPRLVSSKKPAVVLRLAGSNTIGAELGPALAEAWLASKGVTNIHRERGANAVEVQVSGMSGGQAMAVDVKAHGSATAFTSLAAGSADVGMASRRINSSEAAELQGKGLGDLTANVNERVLGLDGVAVIVNDASPVETMTRDEVAAVFSGTANGTWNVYARDDNSGTYDTFKDRVLGSLRLVSSARRFEDSRALAAAVAQDRNGIGFVGLPYAVGVKVLAIAEKGTAPRVPNAMTIRTESYALSRRLYLYVPETAKPEAREFVRFALSPAGQDVVEKNGFVGQKIAVMAAADRPKKSVQLLPTSDRLSVDFRFRTGSSVLDTKAVDDIGRVAAAMSGEFAGRGVILVGFADNTGGAAANLALSKERAAAVAEQMERHGITPALITGFGQELPVADNSTPEGREKNRRVEVWLRK